MMSKVVGNLELEPESVAITRLCTVVPTTYYLLLVLLVTSTTTTTTTTVDCKICIKSKMQDKKYDETTLLYR